MNEPLIGRYRIHRRIARGGMADVFLGSPPGAMTTAEFVAVKRIRPELAKDLSFVKMFLDEAEITRRLNHPNIACLLDWGEDQGVPYLVMEFVRGVSVKHALLKGPFPQHLTAQVGAGVARALHDAHEKTGPDGRPLDIVHRDVTPHNVMVTFDGEVKLLDFGIAKARVRAEKTRTGVLKGKWAYMSPEQIAGDHVDRRSDIFTLGALLHEMLTGAHAFDGDTPVDVLKAISFEQPAPLSEVITDIDPELESVIGTCLEKYRTDRFSTAGEVEAALDTIAKRLATERSGPSMLEFLQRNFLERRVQIEEALDTIIESLSDQPEDDAATQVQLSPATETAPRTRQGQDRRLDAPVLIAPIIEASFVEHSADYETEPEPRSSGLDRGKPADDETTALYKEESERAETGGETLVYQFSVQRPSAKHERHRQIPFTLIIMLSIIFGLMVGLGIVLVMGYLLRVQG